MKYQPPTCRDSHYLYERLLNSFAKSLFVNNLAAVDFRQIWGTFVKNHGAVALDNTIQKIHPQKFPGTNEKYR